jgi:hypothetical protein
MVGGLFLACPPDMKSKRPTDHPRPIAFHQAGRSGLAPENLTTLAHFSVSRVAAYRWCVHSNRALNCRFQSQSACMAAASHAGGWCELTLVNEP